MHNIVHRYHCRIGAELGAEGSRGCVGSGVRRRRCTHRRTGRSTPPLDGQTHNRYDVGVARDRAVDELERIEGEAGDQGTAEAKEVKRARDGSCLRPREVGGVREDCEEHVGGTEDAGAMTVHGDVSKETVEAFESAQRSCRLLAR